MNLGFVYTKPLYAVDEKTGKLVPVDIPVDAVANMAKPGYKAGNPLLDEINEQLRQHNIIEKTKQLYRLNEAKDKE